MQTATTKRPHADLIIAWANGATIEYYHPYRNKWEVSPDPLWRETHNYRIKPEPKPDFCKYLGLYNAKANEGNPFVCHSTPLSDTLEDAKRHHSNSHGELVPVLVKITFDGETGAGKSVEILK